MNELLEHALSAHGGLERWRALRKVHSTVVVGGAFWAMKGLIQDYAPRHVTAALHEERASVRPFAGPNQRTEFSANHIAIVRADGTIITERSNPRNYFAGHEINTPWDRLHRAYFSSYALWTYLTTPFLLSMPGFEVSEVEPWQEGAHVWRRLRARFPDNIASHSQVQDFFFDRDFMLRRHDYRVEVGGRFAAAQYVYDYTEADGIRVPTRRHLFRRDTYGRPLEDLVMVSIDTSAIHYF
jgi:hypothetical protein